MRRTNETVSRSVVISLRRATIEDAPTVFKWRNAPDVRAISESSKELQLRDHIKWFAERLPLTHPDSLWIVTSLSDIDGAEGTPIGSARITLDGKNYARISVLIDPAYRNCGIGQQVIQMLKEKIQRMNRTPVARVHVGNLASLRIFEAAGFAVVSPEQNGSGFVELHASKK